MSQIFVEKYASFIPSEENPLPDISFVPMLMRRRLSMLSKLVIFVNRQVSEGLPNVKITFASEFGEISRQLKVTKSLIDSDLVSPANFSQSVYNASIAISTILESNTKGYSAIFSGKDSFRTGLSDAIAAILYEHEPRIFIFANELIPLTYKSIVNFTYKNKACALALRLTTKASENTKPLPDIARVKGDFSCAADEAFAFLKLLET